MANKLFLDNQDVPYEPSESEDELSEGEKEILKEVRKGKKRKTDAKQEILGFDESADDDDADDIIGDSDIERGDERDGIPDSKAWGKQRRSYYNTDFVDQDYSAYNEQEEEQAQQEEEEAKAIQLRLAKELNEADFFLDLPTGAPSDSDEEEDVKKSKSKKSKERTKLKSDLSNMSERQKRQLFEKDSPEFAGLVEDFNTYFAESQIILTPVMEFADNMDLNMPIFEFVKTMDNMIMTYCTNICFYLLLKSERISIKNHPITKRLVTIKKLINTLQQKYDDLVKPQLEDLLMRIDSGEEIKFDLSTTTDKVKENSKKKLRMMKAFHGEEDEESDEEYQEEPSSKRTKLSDEEDDNSSEEGEDEDVEGEEERRGITYQIAKNKGLMPHRKKELRNPRVKHRSKFRKALIRRKGAVRTVRKETQRYGGELSGIKASTKKGIKIKS